MKYSKLFILFLTQVGNKIFIISQVVCEFLRGINIFFIAMKYLILIESTF